jgi:YHS domain-containing protein/outer membrane lipoprotein-sorting protein
MPTFIVVVAVSCLADVPLKAAEPILGTFPVDPVELVRGKEVTGSENTTAEHYRFIYRFANEANKAEFLANPQKYEIQLGGACARMGPLSGPGDAHRFAVHKGRIYIFASDACRKTFLGDPDKYLDRPDPVPVGTDDAKTEGRKLIEKAIEAMGGAAKLDAVKSYQWQKDQKVQSGGKTYDQTDRVTIAFPDRLRVDYIWDGSRYGWVHTGDGSWAEEPKRSYSLHSQQRDALVRDRLGHNLLAALKSRKQSDFVAVHMGQGEIIVDGKPMKMEKVAAHWNGVTNYVAIDAESGRILAQTFRGQGPNAGYGVVERTFTAWSEHDGLKIPEKYVARFDGEDVADTADATTAIRLDVDLEPGLFARPKSE